MAQWHRSLGESLGGLASSFVSREDGHTYVTEVQSAAHNQKVLDFTQRMRSIQRPLKEKSGTQGRLAAEVPVTIFIEWQKEWERKHKGTYSMETFMAIKLNSREFCKFKAIDSELYIPEHCR